MGLFGHLGQAIGSRLARKLLGEIRGLRLAHERLARATERLADCAERKEVPRSRYGFAGWSEQPLTPDVAEPEPTSPASASYRDSVVYLATQQTEDALRGLLGRDPTEDEVWEALQDREDIQDRLR